MDNFWWQAAWGDMFEPAEHFEPTEDAAEPADDNTGAWHPVGAGPDGAVLWRRCLNVLDEEKFEEQYEAFLNAFVKEDEGEEEEKK